jgi:hypothetical protein
MLVGVRMWQVLCDYIFYHEHNAKKALELCSEGTVSSEYEYATEGLET